MLLNIIRKIQKGANISPFFGGIFPNNTSLVMSDHL